VVSFLERAATLPVRARVPSAHRQGSPSRLSPSRTSCRSGVVGWLPWPSIVTWCTWVKSTMLWLMAD